MTTVSPATDSDTPERRTCTPTAHVGPFIVTVCAGGGNDWDRTRCAQCDASDVAPCDDPEIVHTHAEPVRITERGRATLRRLRLAAERPS